MNRQALFPLPEADAADACRQLGLAISNASVYGITHAVTVSTQTSAYALLENLMDRYGNLEWCTCDEGLLLNGKLVGSLRGTGQVVLDQMRSGNLQSFMFTSPLIRNEFSRFLSLFSNTQGSGATPDGIRAEPFQSIRLDAAAYERAGEQVSGKAQPPPGAAEKTEPGPTRGGRRVFDLDSELEALGSEDLSAPMWPSPASSTDIATGVSRYLEQRREHLSQQAAMTTLIQRCEGDAAALDTLRDKLLAGGLSSGEWQTLLVECGLTTRESRTHAGTAASLDHLIGSLAELADRQRSGSGDPDGMSQALETISREVSILISHTRDAATSLAQRVDADRKPVAEIERQARARGVGLQLSREELLKNLAEINQELIQPLTASSSMLDMLTGGTMGMIPDAQRDVLNMARDGLGRLEKLIAYLQRISGFPVALEPDLALTSEAYATPPGEAHPGHRQQP